MTRSRRTSRWFVPLMAVLLTAALFLWLGGMLLARRGAPLAPPTSPLASESPLPTPTLPPEETTPPAAWTGGGAALLWVAVGTLLGLGLALFVIYRARQTTT